MTHAHHSALGPFIAGVLVGGGAALLFAPRGGRDLRSTLQESASRAKEQITQRAKKIWSTTAERAQEHLKSDQDAINETEEPVGAKNPVN